uniref:Arpin n=1 Tax=Chrysemys picta bellii TaxID=8478 RepID=A0A8C3IME9_CHRPI
AGHLACQFLQLTCSLEYGCVVVALLVYVLLLLYALVLSPVHPLAAGGIGNAVTLAVISLGLAGSLPGVGCRPLEQGDRELVTCCLAVSISCSSLLQERYYVLYIRPSQAHRRKFDAKGNEREPNFSDTRKVNTGFLMSSFKVEAKGDTDRLSPEELKGLVTKPELLSVTERHTPSQAVAFWLLETELEKMELELGAEIRLKTRGDSPFICEWPPPPGWALHAPAPQRGTGSLLLALGHHPPAASCLFVTGVNGDGGAAALCWDCSPLGVF